MIIYRHDFWIYQMNGAGRPAIGKPGPFVAFAGRLGEVIGFRLF
jgi:hypothetical protein